MIDFELTSTMLRTFVSQVIGRRVLSRPRAVMAVPSGVKEMEQKALVSSLFDAGIRRTQLLDKNIAAALGAQANFQGAYGCLVVDMSAGGTDMAVLYNGTVSVLSSVPIGGDHFDDAIIRYLRRKYNLLIGERTAEQVKITLGGAARRDPNVMMDVTGRNLISGLPKTISVESDEMFEALEDDVNDLIEGIQVVLERTPPQLASDIFEGGIVMTGGAANLYGIAEAVSDVLKIPCRVAQDARDCVVLGCAKVLMEPNTLRYLLKR
jgi:rod shape-determining protein MreB